LKIVISLSWFLELKFNAPIYRIRLLHSAYSVSLAYKAGLSLYCYVCSFWLVFENNWDLY